MSLRPVDWLTLERLEERHVLAGTLAPSLVAGELVVQDIAARPNQLSIVVAGDAVVLHDAVEPFTGTGGIANASLSEGDRTLTIPLASLGGAKIFFLGGGGEDVLTIDFTGGAFGKTIAFDGGQDDDILDITGSGQGAVTLTYADADSGAIATSAFGVIEFAGVEALVDRGTLTDLAIHLPAAPGGGFTLADDGVLGNNLSRIGSSDFPITDFSNPTGSLVIHRGAASDSLIVASLPDFNASLTLGSDDQPLAAVMFAGHLSLGFGKALAASASSLTMLSAGTITTGAGGSIAFTADTVTIDEQATIHADAVLITPLSSGRAIDLGTDSSGTLALTDAELDCIDAGLLTIGDAATGTITVRSDITHANPLTLMTGASIVVDRLLSTLGDPLGLAAANDITIHYALATGNGAINVVADSNLDGVGTLTIDLRLGEFIDPNPAAGNQFGQSVAILPNGNVVITSPGDDAGGPEAGAAYLFNSVTGALISTLRGAANHSVGSGGITVLANGNYLVRSPRWDNGSATEAGALTWGHAATGVSGAVGPGNSLVGSSKNDQIGESITTLPNGNYVVVSKNWDNGAAADAGAATWGSGTSGVAGAISAANSLVSSTANSLVGVGGVFVLPSGNYVVRSLHWDDGPVVDAGAVTWSSGTAGVTGVISAANSLIGSSANDAVGNNGIQILSNGHYVVSTAVWNNGAIAYAGAITWGNGMSGVAGVVSAANSLVGTKTGDFVGNSGVTTLSNGNYVVASKLWDNGTLADVGAVTWCDGSTGRVGEVNSANSLIGGAANNQVGSGGATSLGNGDYVVASPLWDNGAATDAGAATWVDGSIEVAGVVGVANSLVGGTSNNRVSSGGVTVVGDHHYVVVSHDWDNGASTDAGAATWGNGATGITGLVSAANSLVGGAASNRVGSGGVTVLTNGNYVVRSTEWDNGSAADVGAVTWGSGASGVVGVVGPGNSLTGSTASDFIGSGGITALSNGNYVVCSHGWDNGSFTQAGAATWGDGTSGVVGVVGSANSIVGGAANMFVGTNGATPLSNGNYVVLSPFWDNGSILEVGAATWGSGTTGAVGVVGPGNSLVGSLANDKVGNFAVALTNGNYVVFCSTWDNGADRDVGAATWGNGWTGISGPVSPANSLIGASKFDGSGGVNVTALANGHYLARFAGWDLALNQPDAGAVAWGNGMVGSTGPIGTANSLVGRVGASGMTVPLVDAKDTFIVRFLNDGSGRVVLGSQAAGSGLGISAGAAPVVLSAGANAGVQPINPRTEIAAGSTSFSGGTDLRVDISGTAMHSQFTQFTTSGTAHLGGVDLVLTGGYVPIPGNAFAIVSAGSVVGEFNDRPNGSIVLFNGARLRIDYTATAVTLVVAAPTVTSITPTIGPTTGGTLVSIHGLGFVNISSVRVAGTALPAASFLVNSSTQITATMPPRPEGAIDIAVVNAAGTGSFAGVSDFTYAKPAVASVQVNGGPGPVRGGTTLNLAGQSSVVAQLKVSFNQAVTVASDAFTVTNHTPVNVIGGASPSTLAVTASATRLNASEYLVSFSGPGTHHGGIINSGVYDLTLENTLVEANGDTMTADDTRTFFAMFGTIDANNTYTANVPPPGVTGDGRSNAFVDPGSLFQFSDAFGSNATITSGAPPYNIVFDYNLDGFVDPGDLFAFSDAFGINWKF